MNSLHKNLDWIDALKAFAIIGILLNHLVESYHFYPWFSAPSADWPDLSERVQNIIPHAEGFFTKIIIFLGWLGDMGPGVFILISGFTLSYSSILKNENKINLKDFYKKRFLRIMPLYIVIHLLTIFASEIISEGSIDIASPKILLSLLGLRFTDGLFFFINPSWWFIGLILQLYIIFPLLYRMLLKLKPSVFLFITLLFTIISRYLGLVDLTYSNSLMNWMYGMFFGTRLIEFTFGMVLAKIFISEKKDLFQEMNLGTMFALSLTIYSLGFLSSLFYYSTLISYLLITIGLTGIFAGIWRLINLNFIRKSVIWIGKASFPVFLLHQAPLLWISNYFSGNIRLLLLISWILLSFPLSVGLEKMVNYFIPRLFEFLRIHLNKILFILYLCLTIQILLSIIIAYEYSGLISNFLTLFFLLTIIFPGLLIFIGTDFKNNFKTALAYIMPITSVLFGFILTDNWITIYWSFIIVVLLIMALVNRVIKSPLYLVLSTLAIGFGIFGSTELYLRINRPLEVGFWGESPAIQYDSITTFNLKPEQTTHLKYNNYDYNVRTNSIGFNSPEVNYFEKDSNEYRIFIIGDAFTMPEGLEFENAYPFLLERELSKHYPDKKITVVNGGVTGFGPNEMIAQLNKNIAIVQPFLVINQVFINEFTDIITSKESLISSCGLDYPSRRKRILLPGQIPEYQDFWIMKHINKDKNNFYKYEKSLAIFYEKNSEIYNLETLKKMDTYFGDIKNLCQVNSSELMVLFVPGQLEVSDPEDIAFYPYNVDLNDTTNYSFELPGKYMRELCENHNLTYVSSKSALVNNTIQPVYYEKSWHWNTEGHKVVAGLLLNKIIEIGYFE